MEPAYDEKTAIKESFSQEPFDVPMSSSRSCFQKIPKRYIMAFMTFLGFANVYALRVNLSVAIIAMVTNHTTLASDGTEITNVPQFQWDSNIRGLILGSFFYGYILTQLPGGWLATKIGGKHLFGIGVLGTAVLTLVSPPAARLSPYGLISLRIMEGIFEGVTYPCAHAIWSKWAPVLERSKLVTISFSGAYFGTVVSMPLSAWIADTLGWAWIFYIFGAVAIVWYVLWCVVVSESPAEHLTISRNELDYIQQGLTLKKRGLSSPLPWKKMLTSLPVLAIVVAHFAENWGFYTLLTELPSFLSDVMDYDLYKAGTMAALPYVVMVVMVQVGGQLADLIRKFDLLSTTNTRKFFTAGAFMSQALFMTIAAFTMTPGAAISCLSFAVGLGGFAWAGFAVNHLDLAPQYASVLMGISNTVATMPGIVSPSVTGSIVTHGFASEWRIVFSLAAVIYCGGAIFYSLFASGNQQEWAAEPDGYVHHVSTPPNDD